MLNQNKGVHILGKVCWLALSASSKAIFGEWVMDQKLIYGRINGFLAVQTRRYKLHEEEILLRESMN